MSFIRLKVSFTFLFSILLFTSNAQNLSLFDIDTTSYPILKAKFYAIDQNGKQIITLTKDNVTIKENNISQKVIRVTNPELTPPTPLSVVLTVDVSGSMTGENIEKAKAATKIFVGLLPFDISECALTSFDDRNYLNKDFTKSSVDLKTAIDQLKPEGGTDYNAGFTKPVTGAFEIAREGKNKRVIIFLTDGLGDANENEILNQARNSNVMVFCITLGMSAPPVLKHVAEKTGGKYFENVNGKSEVAEIYQTILQIAQNSKPSTIEWESTPGCDFGRSIEFTVPAMGLKNNSKSYATPPSKVIRLVTNPSGVKFKNVKLGNNDTTITITAQNSDITITGASSSNPSFSLTGVTFPMIIKKGQEQKIKLRYTATDSTFKTGKIELKNSACAPFMIYANSGLNSKNTRVPLQVIQPNGGEVFYAGSDTTISWSGVLPSDNVTLEYSSNNGKSWEKISTSASQNKFNWKVPYVTSNDVLVRATYGASGGTGKPGQSKLLFERTLDLYTGYVGISPDGSKFLSINDGNTVVCDMAGNKLGALPKCYYTYFNQDGSEIYLINDKGSTSEIYDANTLEKKGTLPPVKTLSKISKDHTKYASENGTTVEIIDLLTGNILKKLQIPSDENVSSFTENFLVTVGENYLTEVFDINSGAKVATFSLPEKYNNRAIMTDDEQYLAVWSWSYNGKPFTVVVFDMNTKSKLYSYSSHNDQFRALDVEGNVMICPYEDKATIIEVSSGKIIKKIEGEYYSGVLSPGGAYAIVGHYSTNNYAGYTTGYVTPSKKLGEDASDKVFSIIKPVITSKNINLGKTYIGEMKDSVISQFLNNKNRTKVEIKSIKISGPDASAFSIVSGNAPFVINAISTKKVEFSFKPERSGTHSANITIISAMDTIVQNITAEGMEKTFSFSGDLINLGEVKIGTSRDSTIKAVLKNIGQSPITITKVENTGPDKTQFTLTPIPAFTLNPGETKDIRISFKPIKEGRATADIEFKIAGSSSHAEVLVYAEGVKELSAPKEAMVTIYGKVLDKATNVPLEADISYHDLNSTEGGKTLKSGPDGSYKIVVPYGKVYGILAEKADHIGESNNINLVEKGESKEIELNIYLSPIEIGKSVKMNNVFFERGKPVLLPESYSELDQLAKLMKKNPNLKIELSGHTDNQGNPALNQKLSEERVATIKNYLVEKGIDQHRVSGKGYGGTKPVASNATEETRRLNRRVEFTVVGK